MTYFWRCAKCEIVEVTSYLVLQLIHTHVDEYSNVLNFSLIACRSMREARSYRVVKRKGKIGLMKRKKAK